MLFIVEKRQGSIHNLRNLVILNGLKGRIYTCINFFIYINVSPYIANLLNKKKHSTTIRFY